MRRCKKCGRCCWKYEFVLLTKREVEEGLFKMEKHPHPSEGGRFSSMVLQRKNVFVPILGEKKKVCICFDEIRNLCTIHPNKPYSCRVYFCWK